MGKYYYLILDTYCLKFPQCRQKPSIPKNKLTIHGLWPGFASGQQLPDCNTGAKIIIDDKQDGVYKRMDELWMSFMGSNSDFWTHEYNKHGYCYTSKFDLKTPDDYFEKVLALYDEFELEKTVETIFNKIVSKELK